MIDLYVCSMDTRPNERVLMSALCQERWDKEAGIRKHRITPASIECKPEEFQRQRRIYAEKHADSPIYIVADDDCLPVGDVVLPMVRLMEKYHGFGILSLMPVNATIQPWTPEGYAPFVDEDIMEHYAVGGIRFCRKGVMKDWPEQKERGYDTAHCAGIRSNGLLVGYAKNVQMNHIGEGASTVWL